MNHYFLEGLRHSFPPCLTHGVTIKRRRNKKTSKMTLITVLMLFSSIIQMVNSQETGKTLCPSETTPYVPPYATPHVSPHTVTADGFDRVNCSELLNRVNDNCFYIQYGNKESRAARELYECVRPFSSHLMNCLDIFASGRNVGGKVVCYSDNPSIFLITNTDYDFGPKDSESRPQSSTQWLREMPLHVWDHIVNDCVTAAGNEANNTGVQAMTDTNTTSGNETKSPVFQSKIVRMWIETIDKLKNVSIRVIVDNAETERQLKNDVFTTADALEKYASRFARANGKLCHRNNDEVILQARRVSNPNERDFNLAEGDEGENFITVPSRDLTRNGSVIVELIYKDLHELISMVTKKDSNNTSNAWQLNSIIISGTIDPPRPLKQNVTVGFRNLQMREGKRKCVFWNYSQHSPEGWSEVGCTVQSMSTSQTVCSCNHLMHFAVLMQFEDDKDSSSTSTETDDRILSILTYVGLALSLLGNILTIICYLTLTDVNAPLSQIRVSLAASLGAGELIFLAGIDATENTGACVAVAALMQYFLMVAFCCMLFEGIYLYLFIVKVYNINNKMFTFHAFSWGFPAVLIVLSLSIAAGMDGIESFVSSEYCWISSTHNLKWIFIAFVTVVEVVNLLILVRVIREMSMMEEAKDDQSEQLRLAIRACVVLIPLLGITWLFGLLLSIHTVFAYIFTVLNSTQGFFVFLLHCVRNGEIRERFKRKIKTFLPDSDERTTSRVRSEDNKSDSLV